MASRKEFYDREDATLKRRRQFEKFVERDQAKHTGHKIRVRAQAGRHMAVCSCLWRGEWTTAEAAHLAGVDHITAVR